MRDRNIHCRFDDPPGEHNVIDDHYPNLDTAADIVDYATIHNDRTREHDIHHHHDHASDVNCRNDCPGIHVHDDTADDYNYFADDVIHGNANNVIVVAADLIDNDLRAAVNIGYPTFDLLTAARAVLDAARPADRPDTDDSTLWKLLLDVLDGCIPGWPERAALLRATLRDAVAARYGV